MSYFKNVFTNQRCKGITISFYYLQKYLCNYYHITGHIKQYNFLGSNLAISFDFQIFFCHKEYQFVPDFFVVL